MILLRRAVFAAVFAAVFGSGVGVAQEPEEGTFEERAEDTADNYETVLEEVIVTGSRIPRSGYQFLQPTTVVEKEQLDLRANLNIADTLTELPGVGQGSSPVGGQGQQIGKNTINFLGLGTQRTLTLVNGLRFPASGLNGLAVDYNNIPSAIVQRVEIVSIGGAPIYGADAIAGTINVILRDDFEGFEVMGSYGASTEYSDNESWQASATWGSNFSDNRGNIAITAQYDHTDGLLATDRPLTSTVWGFETPADPDSPYDFLLFDDLTIAVDSLDPLPLFYGDQFFFNTFGNGIPLDIFDPESPFSAFDRDGNLVPFTPGGGTGSVVFVDGGDGLRLSELEPLFADIERANLNLFFNYDVTDSTRFHAEAWYANTQATELVTQGYYNSNIFGGLPNDSYQSVGEGPIGVRIDNPFLPAASREAILAALNIVHDFNGDGQADPTLDTDGDGIPDAVGFWRTGNIARITNNSTWSSDTDFLRGVVGFDGEIRLGDRTYLWDSYLTWGEYKSNDSNTALLQSRFEQAVQVIPDANGNPVCADPSGGCVPLNVIGTPTPEAIGYVTARTTDITTVDQTTFTANLTGDVADLPAGPLAMAIGFSWRDEGAKYEPDEVYTNGMARFEATPVNGGFDSTELYLEALVPLLGGNMDTPGVHLLEFEGALRYVDNSLAGADTTWTAGLRYMPTESLELRGNYTRAIRAPSIVELFLPEATTSSFASDPCDTRFIDQGNYPERRRANCAAEGIPDPFQSFVVNASAPGSVSGNQNLSNETADSYTFGVVVRPSSIPGLIFSIDWLDIEIDDAIANLGLTSIMNGCYESADFANEPLCDLFARDSLYQVSDFRIGFQNINNISWAGLQFVGSYLLDMERYGDLRFNLNYLYSAEGEFTEGTDAPVDVLGQIGTNESSFTFSATWNVGNWTVFGQTNWLSSAVFSNSDDEFTRDLKGVGSWYVVNASLGYRLGENSLVQLNINNLFDKEAPYGSLASGGGLGTYYDGVIGRTARITFRTGF